MRGQARDSLERRHFLVGQYHCPHCVTRRSCKTQPVLGHLRRSRITWRSVRLDPLVEGSSGACPCVISIVRRLIQDELRSLPICTDLDHTRPSLSGSPKALAALARETFRHNCFFLADDLPTGCGRHDKATLTRKPKPIVVELVLLLVVLANCRNCKGRYRRWQKTLVNQWLGRCDFTIHRLSWSCGNKLVLDLTQDRAGSTRSTRFTWLRDDTKLHSDLFKALHSAIHKSWVLQR